jgi:hypothetical protein
MAARCTLRFLRHCFLATAEQYSRWDFLYEVRAIELLLSGPIADGEDEEESPIAQISRRSSGCPAEWSGSIEDFERIMDQSMQLYFSW